MSLPIELPALNIQLRMTAPYDVVLTTGMPAGEMSARTVGLVMDILTEVAERERLKGELASLRTALRRNEEMLSTRSFEKQVAEIRRQRAQYDAGISALWVNSARRGDPKMNEKQRGDMAKFEQQIEQIQKAKLDVENGLLLMMWQIDCLAARITEQAEPPMPEEVKAALADLDVEEIGFTPSIAA